MASILPSVFSVAKISLISLLCFVVLFFIIFLLKDYLNPGINNILFISFLPLGIILSIVFAGLIRNRVFYTLQFDDSEIIFGSIEKNNGKSNNFKKIFQITKKDLQQYKGSTFRILNDFPTYTYFSNPSKKQFKIPLLFSTMIWKVQTLIIKHLSTIPAAAFLYRDL